MENNQVTKKPTNAVAAMTTFLSSTAVKDKINRILGKDGDGDRFISNLVSNVQQNPALAECTQGSLINGALAGHILHLDYALQQFYLVPFKDTKRGVTNAQFLIGYKGYKQLAIRSGQYKKFKAMEVKEGELVEWDPFEDEGTFNWIKNPKERQAKKTEYYLAFFELKNGYRQTLLWSVEEMEEHALKYSKSYASDKRYNTNKSFWSMNFDAQAKKTMVRQLLTKEGVLSIDIPELNDAYHKDMGVIHEDGKVEYVDNAIEIVEEETTIEPTINDEQVQALCDRIIEKTGKTVPEFMQEKKIDDVNAITITEYTQYMKELA